MTKGPYLSAGAGRGGLADTRNVVEAVGRDRRERSSAALTLGAWDSL